MNITKTKKQVLQYYLDRLAGLLEETIKAQRRLASIHKEMDRLKSNIEVELLTRKEKTARKRARTIRKQKNTEYTKEEQEKWEEFEQVCLVSGIDEKSFCGTDDLFKEFEKYKKWRKNH